VNVKQENWCLVGIGLLVGVGNAKKALEDLGSLNEDLVEYQAIL
jgi:hypothetical protein